MGERGSSKADTLVKVVLVFFISLLSFSVGTFVGKQVSDSEHRKIALEGEFKGEGGREIASEKEEHGAAEPGKISEKEVASLTEEFVNKEGDAHEGAAHGDAHAADAHGADAHATVAEGHGDAHPTEAAKPDADGYKTYARKGEGGRDIASDEGHDVKADAHEEKATAATEPAHHAAAKAPEKKSEAKAEAASDEHGKAAPALPSVANSAVGKWTVQVASYAEEKEAQGHAAKLKGKGFQAFYLPAKLNGKDWYRVLVGLFSTSKSAEEYKAQIIKDGGTKAAFVQKIVQ